MGRGGEDIGQKKGVQVGTVRKWDGIATVKSSVQTQDNADARGTTKRHVLQARQEGYADLKSLVCGPAYTAGQCLQPTVSAHVGRTYDPPTHQEGLGPNPGQAPTCLPWRNLVAQQPTWYVTAGCQLFILVFRLLYPRHLQVVALHHPQWNALHHSPCGVYCDAATGG
jgi:hypothetical protein